MEQVRIDFLVTGNLSSLQKQVQGLNAQLMASAAHVNMLDRSMQNLSLRSANSQFADLLVNSNQFDHRMVTLQSHTEGFGKSLASSALSARALKTEMMKYRSGEIGQIRQLATEQVRLQNSIVQPTGRSASGAMQAQVFTPTGLATDAATQARVAAKEFEILNEVQKQSAERMVNWGKNTQWAGRQLMVGFTVPLAILGGLAAKNFNEFDTELVRLQKVYGSGLTFGDDFKKQGDMIREEAIKISDELASVYGQAGTETAALMADLAAAGYEGPDLTTMTKEVTRLATLGEMATTEASKATIALRTAFKIPAEELGGTVDFMNAVENQTSLSLEDLTQAIPRAGTVVRGLGGDIQDLAVMLTAMKEGGVSAAEGANAIKSGLSSIIAPPQAAVDFLKNLKINLPQIVLDNQGDLMGTVMALQNALAGLNDLQRQQAITKLFGKYQFARMSALFDNLGAKGSQTQKVFDLMGMSLTDLGTIADQELATKLESASGKFKRTWATFQQSLMGVGEVMLNVGTTILSVLNKIGDILDSAPILKSFLGIATAGAAIAGPVIMFIGLVGNMVGMLRKGWLNIRNMVKSTGSVINKTFTLTTVEQEAAKVATDKMNMSLYKEETAVNVLADAVARLVGAYEAMEIAAKGAASASAVPLVGKLSADQQQAMALRARSETKGFIPGSAPINQGNGAAPRTAESMALLPDNRLAAMGAMTRMGTALRDPNDPLAAQLKASGTSQTALINAEKAAAQGNTAELKRQMDLLNREGGLISRIVAEEQARLASMKAQGAQGAFLYAQEIRLQELKRHAMPVTMNSNDASLLKALSAVTAHQSGFGIPNQPGQFQSYFADNLDPRTGAEIPLNLAPAPGNPRDASSIDLEHLTASSQTLEQDLREVSRIEEMYGHDLTDLKTALVKRTAWSNKLNLSEADMAAIVATGNAEMLQMNGAIIALEEQMLKASTALTMGSGSFASAMEKASLQYKNFDLPTEEMKAFENQARLLTQEMGETNASFDLVQAGNKRYLVATNKATKAQSVYRYSPTATKGTALVGTPTKILAALDAESTARAEYEKQMTVEKKEQLRLATAALDAERERFRLAQQEAVDEKEKAAFAKEGMVAEMGSTGQDRMQTNYEREQTAMKAGSTGMGSQGLASMFGMQKIPFGKAGMAGFGALGAAGMASMFMPETENAALNTGVDIAGGAATGAMMGAMAGPWGAAIGGIIGAGIPAVTSLMDHFDKQAEEAAVKWAAEVEASFGRIEVSNQVGDALGLGKLETNTQLNVNMSGLKSSTAVADYQESVKTGLGPQIEQMKSMDAAAATEEARKMYLQYVAQGADPQKMSLAVQEALRQAGQEELIIPMRFEMAKTTTEKSADQGLKAIMDAQMKDAVDGLAEIRSFFDRANAGDPLAIQEFWMNPDNLQSAADSGKSTGMAYANGFQANIEAGLVKDKNYFDGWATNSKKMVSDMAGELAPTWTNALSSATGWDSNKSMTADFLNLDTGEEQLAMLQELEQAKQSAVLDNGQYDVQTQNAISQQIAYLSTLGQTTSEYDRILKENNPEIAAQAAALQAEFPMISEHTALMRAAAQAQEEYAKAMQLAEMQSTFSSTAMKLADKDAVLHKTNLEKLGRQQAKEIEALQSAEDDRLQAMQDAADKREAQMQKEIDQVQAKYDKEIAALQKTEDKRQEAFQREQEIFARRQEMRNMEISYDEAIANGDLYEAARVRMDMAAKRKQHAASDEEDKRQKKAQREIDQLQREEDKKVSMMEKTLEHEQKMNEKAIASAQEASDAKIAAAERANRIELKNAKETNNEIAKDAADNNEQIARMWTALQNGNLAQFKKIGDKIGIDAQEQATLLNETFGGAAAGLPGSIFKSLTKAIAQEDWGMINSLMTLAVEGGSKKELKQMAGWQARYDSGGSPGADATRRASGGFITGRGSATSDDIPAYLSNGEYVIRQGVVARYGKNFFDSINNTGRAPAPTKIGGTGVFAKGGPVGKMGDVGNGMVGPLVSSLLLPWLNSIKQTLGANVTVNGSDATAGKPGMYGGTMFTSEQLKNAAIIASVGKQVGATQRDIVTALTTAMTESTLHNYTSAVDHDSLGLFQQRPSAGWGTPEQITDPVYASKKFYSALMSIGNREDMPIGDAAQQVQVSAYPDRYQEWVEEARAVMKSLTFSNAAGMSDPKRAKMVSFAEKQLGEPYIFGAAGPNSWDCSGLTMAAAEQVGIGLVHQASQQWAATQRIATQSAQAGDLVFFNPGTSGAPAGLPGHVGVMTGNTGFIHAANPDLGVLRGDLRTTGNDYVGMGKIPGLRSGGKINYDNTIANLHRGETVLTAPLTKSFEDNVANSGPNQYNFNVDTIELHKEMDLEREFMKFTAAHERQQERRNGRGRSI